MPQALSRKMIMAAVAADSANLGKWYDEVFAHSELECHSGVPVNCEDFACTKSARIARGRWGCR